MLDTAIIDAIDTIKTALLVGNDFSNVYEYIPQKPNYPCVIIAPGEELIGDSETFGRRQVAADIYIIAAPSADNKTLQQSLYTLIAKAIDLLDSGDDIQCDIASRPFQIEYNQAKTIASIIEANILI